MLGDALGRHLRGDRRNRRRIAADQRDIDSVALVAGARVGDVVERDGRAVMARLQQRHSWRAYSRSIRQEALASRGVRRRRTPQPPAGPAQ